MRPVPVPVIARLLHDGAVPKVLAGPGGDLLDPNVAPVEILRDIVEDEVGDRYDAVRLYLTPEHEDLDLLREGGTIELTLLSGVLPVFQVAVLPAG